MMNNKNCASGLLVYFFVSFSVLTIAGLIFKGVFLGYNISQFPDLTASEITHSLIWGVRFDMASAAFLTLLSCIVVWISYRLKLSVNPSLTLLAIMLVAQMSFQVGDSIYYTDAGRHVSYEMRDAMADASGLFLTAITYHVYFILVSAVLGFLVLLLSLSFSRRVMSGYCEKESVVWKFNLQYEAAFILVLLFATVFVRGGLTGLPQSVISAFKIGDPDKAVVAMNGAYSVIYGVFNSSKEVKQVSVNLPQHINVKKIMRDLYPEATLDGPDSGGKKYNLIFIFMEGWPAEIMASYGYDQKTTPFFDSILEKSHAPLGVVAGGRRTTEGLFSTLCSHQNPLGETVAQSSLQNFSYTCLPAILKDRGWSTAFFQGSHKETSGTGAFAQSMGFVESYAKEDMPKGRYQRNFWGAHDPDIYDFVINKIDTMPEPFMIGINTNSTHDTSLPEGASPNFEEDDARDAKRNALYFSDQAMREFFNKLKDRSYYKNTVFVLVSDHTSGRRSSIFAKYLAPGVIYAEDIVPGNKVDRFVSQRDIAPTVLEILELPPATSFTGKSFYKSANEDAGDSYFSDYYDSGSIGWIKGLEIVETSVIQPDNIKCYSINALNMKLNSKECDEQSKYLSEESLAFTSYSQELLFKGETEQFFRFLDE
jgi:phosphoglycerol transferase MdoB-like AlkP superfamily enzyme